MARAPAKQPKKNGRPTKRTDVIVEKLLDGLSTGTPLAVVCREVGVSTDAVYEWMEKDEDLSRRIARARDLGWDAIAMDAVAIADDPTNDTIKVRGFDMPNKEWIERSKLRVYTRLQLLAKWDPKRYGDKMQHVGDGGGAIKLNVSSEDAAL